MTLLLLDTHVWIWLMEGGEGSLSGRMRNRILAAGQQDRLRIAAITLWEASMLEAKGRVRLGKDCLAWVNEALTAPGISIAPLTLEIAVESNHLPGGFHGDPADRLIVATARRLDASLVTKDERILEYSRKGFVKALQA